MRVYYADGEPINYTTTYLPLRYFPGLEKHDFSSESLYDTLEKRLRREPYPCHAHH